MTHEAQRLIVVSNRLPVAVTQTDQGRQILPSPGGLVTALGPVLREHGGRWIGWPGATTDPPSADELSKVELELGYPLHPVPLTQGELEGHYHGFSNEVLWPLFHDFIGRCNFDPAYWPVFRSVNGKFAEAIAEASEPDDYVWIHDYQLVFVAQQLARMGVRREVGYFLHIPFPSPDMFFKMPWRQQVLEGLLEHDLVGFQAPRDQRNFLDCVRQRVEGAIVEDAPDDRARVRLADGRSLLVGAFPISIDYDDFLQRSVEHEVSEVVARVRASMPGRTIILGLDRLDYTKGIPLRLQALDDALRRYPELLGQVSLLQVVIPSRTRVDDYRQLKDEIDRLVGNINGTHARAGWTPIHYLFRSLEPTELLAFYRVSEVALITPLKDGMNLVAKEYCACSLEGNGVLVLSEFAGAAAQLADGALIVNPFDIEQVADAIHRAVTMPETERRPRMNRLRQLVREHDVHRWVGDYLGAARQARGH
ncbi:MAG: trehalose-6-phosphate synthase [Nannocystaceae bacterium]